MNIFERLAGAQLPHQRHGELAHAFPVHWLCQTGCKHAREGWRHVGKACKLHAWTPGAAAAGAGAAPAQRRRQPPAQSAGQTTCLLYSSAPFHAIGHLARVRRSLGLGLHSGLRKERL